jgi:hypothetical protein
LASSINDANDTLSEKVLRTAARLGVPRYRLKYYKYDLRRPVLDQAKEAAKDPEPVVKAIRDDLTTLRRWLFLANHQLRQVPKVAVRGTENEAVLQHQRGNPEVVGGNRCPLFPELHKELSVLFGRPLVGEENFHTWCVEEPL